MTVLDVPGARLYYETRGSGPLLVMVPGAAGHGDSFAMVAQHLAARYAVVTYDRRGFSRSRLDGPQDYAHRLATETDDVRRLIEHLGDEPAIIFGTSSGGIVALDVLARHPAVVRTVVPYEPAAISELSDAQRWIEFFHHIYDRYRTSGIQAARTEFRARAFSSADGQAMGRGDAMNSEYAHANAVYWFEHELRQYPAVKLDIGALAAYADRIVLASGRESHGQPCYEVNVVLGKRLGLEVVEMSGGHVGFATHPAEFADELVRVLARH